MHLSIVEYELNDSGNPINIKIEKTNINDIEPDSNILCSIFMHDSYISKCDRVIPRGVNRNIFKNAYIDVSMMEFPKICEYWQSLYNAIEKEFHVQV